MSQPAPGRRDAGTRILRTQPAENSARPDGDLAARRPGVRVNGLLAIAGLIVVAGLIEFYLRHLLTIPFYSDEAWRAYDISLGAGFLNHLDTSGAPLALGWVGIENVARLVFGDTETGLRAAMFLALPALAVATYLLARRWLGVGVSFCTAALLLVNSWIVNNALQLKSYSYEGLLAIAAVALYLLLQRAGRRPAQMLGLYAALGLACVFSLPNLFVVGPLLALDLVQTIRHRGHPDPAQPTPCARRSHHSIPRTCAYRAHPAPVTLTRRRLQDSSATSSNSPSINSVNVAVR